MHMSSVNLPNIAAVYEVSILHGRPKARTEFNCLVNADSYPNAWQRALNALYIERGIKEPIKPEGLITPITQLDQILGLD